MAKRVFIGLSGGVDSALACALLVEQGFDVTAVYMKNWSQDLPGFHCPWAEDLACAERIVVTLGIPLLVWDCEKEYKQTVVDYLVDAYSRGQTPNPDVMCNQTIKFGTFAKQAFEQGADYIATGHYARVSHDASKPALLRSCDEHKDQTYFLWRVSAEVFGRVLFPIGDFKNKAEVRAECAKRGLGVENKPDSDGICFIGPVGIRSFLLNTLERKEGDVVEWESGRVLGHHDGAFLFTVGQRRGLDLGGGPARYVVSTDTIRNIVYVTSDKKSPSLLTSTLELSDTHWISGDAPQEGTYLVRTRHTGKLRQADLELDKDKRTAHLRFFEPIERVANGQSAVVYNGAECLGGGIITGPEPLRM